MLKRVCVFCGSNVGARAEYRRAAESLGTYLAERGIGLVYGGGNVGLMGAVADAALASRGEVIGVIPQSIVDREIAHHGVTELRIVASMHERKAMMADFSDAFIALPGGYGTFEEFCEVLTWSQLGIHKKPCGLLNVADYYTPLLAMFDHAVNERFVRKENRGLVLAHHEHRRLIEMLEEFKPAGVEKWIDGATR
jgi:uncharacterized protein (TIGR00730 family)